MSSADIRGGRAKAMLRRKYYKTIASYVYSPTDRPMGLVKRRASVDNRLLHAMKHLNRQLKTSMQGKKAKTSARGAPAACCKRTSLERYHRRLFYIPNYLITRLDHLRSENIVQVQKTALCDCKKTDRFKMGQTMSYGLTQYDVDELIEISNGACKSPVSYQRPDHRLIILVLYLQSHSKK